MSATTLARAVVRALLEAGVREVVVAPGSRNAPLSFAALAAAEAGLVRLHTRIDERSAGFLALGLSKQGARAAVICTSGTAVANVHPAVLEAVHADVPLVVVSADRPLRLRGSDANQSTEQVGVFGALVGTRDVTDEAGLAEAFTGSGAVVHLNVRLEEPLVPADAWSPAPLSGPPTLAPQSVGPATAPSGGSAAPLRTVVVAGDDAGPRARQWAEASGVPLLAEPSSGARTGANAVRCYRLLLGSELGDQVEQVVVFGHPTLSRPVTRLLGRADIAVLAEPGRGAWPRRSYPHQEIVGLAPLEGSDPAWLAAWREADRSVSRQLDALLAAEPDVTPYEVAGAVSRAVPRDGLLFVGASSPIRDLDLMARPYPVGERRKVAANRGLAGIDGTISTAVGMALARASSRAFALMGDVTFLHDANGLVVGPGQPAPDLTIVVVNDDGGSIFTMLEQGAPAHAGAFETLFGTPHGVDLAALCSGTRTPYWRVGSIGELEQALASPNGGVEVIEVRVRRDNRRELDERIRSLRP